MKGVHGDKLRIYGDQIIGLKKEKQECDERDKRSRRVMVRGESELDKSGEYHEKQKSRTAMNKEK